MSGQGSLPASNHASTSSDNISTTSSASSKLSWSTPWLRHNNQGVTHVFFPAGITIDLSLPEDEAQRLKDVFKLAARSGINKVKELGRRVKELEQQAKDLQSQLLHSNLSTGRTINIPDPSERSFSSSYLAGYSLPPPMTYHRLRRTSPVESLRSVYTEHSSRSHLSSPSIQISDSLELDNIKGRTNYAKAVISRDLNRGANPRRKWSDVAMASSEVDTKFLAQFANNISGEQPLLSSQLYRVLGNLTMLAPLVIRARKERRLDPTRHTKSIKLYCTIIWYARNGLIILEEYILPMTTGATELRVLAHKLRASYFHLYVLFHNSPPITLKSSQVHTPPGLKSPRERTVKLDKGKGIDRGSPDDPFRPSSVQPTHPLEGGPVGGEGPPPTEFAPDFLIPAADYRGTTLRHFEEACAIADGKLWGSHPLRLSAKVEMCAFLYDCLHMHDRSRLLAKTTIAEVYNAVEGMDDDMFEDAAELVGILGRMMKRGLGSGGSGSAAGSSGPRSTPGAGGMLNPI